VTFVGAYLDDASQRGLLRGIVRQTGVRPVMETPLGVEACRRVTATGEQVFILINHTRTEQKLALPWQAQEHLRSKAVEKELSLEPYGVAVITAAS
jgi:beta-galactosidase GanA